MNVPLALGLVLVTSIVCGIALWPVAPVAAAVAPPSPVLAASPADDLAGHEGELARTVLALLPDELRARAIVGSAPGAEVMLQRQVPASAVAVGGGVPLAAMPELPRGLALRLLQHAARALGGTAAPAPTGVAFAFAGSRRAGDAFYVRLHGGDFAAEWVVAPDGVLRGAWRDFTRDAAAPWLAATVFAARR